MTINRDDVRKAQAAHLEGEPELVERANALYDAMDALTDHQKHILIEKALLAVNRGLPTVAGEPDQHTRVVNGFTLTGLTSLAGYCAASLVEDADEDSATSKAVDAIFEQYKESHQTMIARSLGLSPEEREKADRVAERIAARVDAGEDPQAALRAEVAASDFDPDTIEKTIAASLAAEKEKEQFKDGGTGLYL